MQKLRATRDSDKVERRTEILDAAERLFLARPTGLANMDELAKASGVAKGTLYLYFPSKEEVLLALHERHADILLEALSRCMAETPRLTPGDLFDVVQRQVVELPAWLPVSTLVVGYLERSLPRDRVIQFKTSQGTKLLKLGADIERAFDLPQGEGLRMVEHSFALILGLWQITGSGRVCSPECDPELLHVLKDFPSELRRGLETLWRGAIRRSEAAPEPAPRPRRVGRTGPAGKAGPVKRGKPRRRK